MRNSVLLLAVVFAVACSKSPTAPMTGTTPPVTPAAGPRVIFPDGFVVQVEIAANDETRAQGLMYRDQLRPGTGMIFFFPQDGFYPFWMKNTLIPLDMIWIDSGKRIVSLTSDVPPCKADPCPSHPPAGISRYVLEVAGGVARQHGLKAGDVLRFEGLDNVVVR